MPGASFGPAAGAEPVPAPAAPVAHFGPAATAAASALQPPAGASAAPAAHFGPAAAAHPATGGTAPALADVNPFRAAYTAGGSGVPTIIPAAPAVGHGLGGLAGRALSDAAGAVAGLPGGVAHLGYDLGKSAINGARQAPIVHAIPGVGIKQLPGESNAAYTQRVFPIAKDFVSPTVGTARTVGGIGQGVAGTIPGVDLGHGLSHETAQKYSAHPVGSLLSDALGASIVLGPADSLATKALGEDSAAAGVVGKVAEATHAVANAPVKPFQFVGEQIAGIPAVADRLAAMKAGAQVADFRSENFTQPAREAQGNVYKTFVPGSMLSPTEQAALVISQRNELGLVAPHIDAMAPADKAALFDAMAKANPNDAVTPEALALADKYQKGLLPADQTARLDRAAAVEKAQVRDPRTAGALAGKGMTGGAKLNAEQTGFSPLSANIDAATEGAMKNLPAAQKLADSLRAKADTAAADLGQFHADTSASLDSQPGSKLTFQDGKSLGKLAERASATDAAATRAEELTQRIHDNVRATAAKAALDPANAPARLRPMLSAAQDAVKQLHEMGGPNVDIANEIVPTLAGIRAAGIDAEHVIGGSDTRPIGSPRYGTPTEKATGAQIRRLGNTTEYTATGQAGLEIRRALEGVKNEFAQRAADPASGLVKPVEGAEGLAGADLVTAARLQGLVPFDPTKSTGSSFFPKGDGNVAPADVTASTRFMPKPIYDALVKQEPQIPEAGPGKWYDRLNTIVRKNPLLLSPSYHLRIATSNAMMTGLAGNLDVAHPIELARRFAEAARELKDGTAPRATVRGGLFAPEQALSDARRAGQDEGTAAKAFHGPVRIGQKLSATIDNFSRTFNYLAEKDKGYSDEEAVTRANKAIGNYDRLSPTEQNIIKRALPIYPWLKQVATVAARLGKDHPIASMFALHAASLFDQNQPNGLPSYLRGSIGIGGNKFVPTDLANPFAVLTSSPQAFTSPLLKAPAAAAFGLNLSTMRQYTRPIGPSQPTADGPLIKNPGELGYVLAGLNPVSKFIRDSTVPHGNILRYQTGEPKVDAKTGTFTPTGRPSPAAALAGLPVPEKVPVESNAAKSAKAKASAVKSAANYAKKVKRATARAGG